LDLLSLDRARQEGKHLRLKLRIHDPKLAALPWEFLYDHRLEEYVSLYNTAIIRYPDVPLPIQPMTVAPPLRILGMVVSPPGLPPLDTANETERIEVATKELRAKGLVDLHWLAGPT
jgi:hypothetical protein